jgi:hypothetical protein
VTQCTSTLTTSNLKKTAFTLLCCTALMLVLAGAPTAVAQSPSFTDFSSTTNLTPNGSAVAPVNNGTSNVLRLTPAAMSEAGSAWFNIQQPVSGGFTTVFKFQFTQGSNPPADGIAFVIQNSGSGLSALGQAGGSIGYADGGLPCGDVSPPCGGIPDSLAVEFDTFDNDGATADPNGNHIAVQSCGIGQRNSPAHGTNAGGFLPCPIGAPVIPAFTMSDGAVHTVIIDYTPPTCNGDCGLGTLTVNLDGAPTNVLTTPVTLENEMNLNSGNAWVGFTSGTGTLFENHDILSWTFTPHTSTTVEEIIPPGQQGVFNFGSFNYKVTNTTTEDMDVSVKAIPLSPPGSFGPNFPTAKCIVYDGTGGNCWEFEATCISGMCESADFPLSTSYDATGPFPGPGFLKGPAPCSTTIFATNQITEFLVLRNDPTTKGTSGGGISCWGATINTTPYGAFIQQPINADGSSVFAAKRGVVPVKFSLTSNGSATCSLPQATIIVRRIAGGTLGSIDETMYTMSADSGSYFRISGCQYVYNLAASVLGAGTYLVDISIAGSVVGSAEFALK